jgi:hypothetical protein
MLDTLATEAVLPPWAATMVRMQIQTVDRAEPGQRDGQPELCVPPMVTQGDSFRLTEATTGKGVKPLT